MIGACPYYGDGEFGRERERERDEAQSDTNYLGGENTRLYSLRGRPAVLRVGEWRGFVISHSLPEVSVAAHTHPVVH